MSCLSPSLPSAFPLFLFSFLSFYSLFFLLFYFPPYKLDIIILYNTCLYRFIHILFSPFFHEIIFLLPKINPFELSFSENLWWWAFKLFLFWVFVDLNLSLFCSQFWEGTLVEYILLCHWNHYSTASGSQRYWEVATETRNRLSRNHYMEWFLVFRLADIWGCLLVSLFDISLSWKC